MLESCPGACRERAAELEHRVSELERQAIFVLGHGSHQGKIADMAIDLNSHDNRLTALEQVRWRLAGAVMLAGSLTGVVLFALSKLLR